MKASSEVKLVPEYAELQNSAGRHDLWVHLMRVKQLRQVQGWARKGRWI